MRWIDWLNRVLAVVALLLVLVVALAVALAPSAVAGGLREAAVALEQPAFGAGWFAVLGAALIVALACLFLLALELRVRRPGMVALAGDSGARLAADTIVQRLKSDVEALPDVDQAFPTVTPRRRSVDIVLNVTTAPAVDVPAKAAQVSEVARSTVEALGLKLGKLSVQLSHTSRAWPGRGSRTADQPAPPPPAEPPAPPPPAETPS